MIRDLFDLWCASPDDAMVHPADALVFSRVPHGFRRDCLPIGFFGPLRTAPVVLLFLSPGYSDPFDREHARSPEGQAYYRGQRDGRGRLPSASEHGPAHAWLQRILRQFAVDVSVAADKVAVLNIGAYHSASFADYGMLTALPSSRAALDHAQTVLFPAAEAGDRTVVCLRSARLWGLSPGEKKVGQRYGSGLFVPPYTQGGLMHHGEMRSTVIEAVRAALR